MNIENVNNIVKLTSGNGIIDIRNNKVYSEVIINQKDIKYFKDNGDTQ